jgi:hypothetical protein
VPGSVHDLKLLKNGEPLPKNTIVIGDADYQGIGKLHESVLHPFKKPKGEMLDEKERDFNKSLSRIRIKVEHIFG